MKPVPQEHRTVSVSELVCKLLGHQDKVTCDLITFYALERTAKKPGLDAIPKEFRQRGPQRPRGRRRLSYVVSPQSMTFFENLLDLSALLPPRVVARLARREIPPNEIEAELVKARQILERRAAVFQRWLDGWDEAANRLQQERLDLSAGPLLTHGSSRSRVRDGAPRSSYVGSAPLDLYLMHRLEQVEKRTTRKHDPVGVEAEKALYLLRLGEANLAESMIEEALRKKATHPFANYAAATIVLARARQRTKEANYFSVMSQEAKPEHEAQWEEAAAEAACDVLARRRAALERLLHAYEHWPVKREGRSISYIDPRRRDSAMSLALDIAFDFSHEHRSIDADDFARVRARKKGEAIPSFFGRRVDHSLVNLLHALEGGAPLGLLRNRFALVTKILQLYFMVSSKDYDRFGEAWKAELGRAPAAHVEPYLLDYAGGNPTALVVREHLHRLFTDEERTSLLADLKRRHQAATDIAYGDFAIFLADVGDYTDKDNCDEV